MSAPEAERLASGWKLSLRVFERLRRIEEGRPLLELVKPENRPGPA